MFLTALAKQFGSRTELVSIAVAGPTASSEEMILPARQNTNGVVQLNGHRKDGVDPRNGDIARSKHQINGRSRRKKRGGRKTAKQRAAVHC
jgi:hypothetical protein